MPFIQFDHKPLFFTLRRSERAKRLHIIARASVFEVVAPWHIKNRAILQFISQQRRWMSKQLQRQTKKALEPKTVWPSQWLAGERISYRGTTLLLLVEYGREYGICQQEEKLMVTLPWQTKCTEMENVVQKGIERWYQSQAMQVIEASLERFCPILGRWPKAVQLKQQKSRWGSCGITERIYLNWLLILAPPGTLEYVVAHELAHLLYRNHGPRFWHKVSQLMPDFAQYDQWLNRFGCYLKPS
ncbi:YgjP-like metallopeptidase domain-containing protein [Candidatus Berkiella aquae]|uniref:M48 family metallopeptidase n=1 Tax=Candidatus Berkiella aquae TaxID=295108 RepID=A0A0Q9Z0S2_9GAMM|nr:SprT family zinc-dependent metalloprotease [Candidatus Berkiella aquae]MCS5712730.1 M48 family metallopeptidase [Candidatus Berkiella aquae]